MVILCLGDVEDGGETVFPQGHPLEEVDENFNVLDIPRLPPFRSYF